MVPNGSILYLSEALSVHKAEIAIADQKNNLTRFMMNGIWRRAGGAGDREGGKQQGKGWTEKRSFNERQFIP